MGAVKVVFYTDEDVSIRQWLKDLPTKAYARAIVRVERLGELGHELRRPEADYLRDGIYELRWRMGTVNYRLLYFFYGREIVVLANGVTKEDKVPEREIDLALKRKVLYESNPETRSHAEEEL